MKKIVLMIVAAVMLGGVALPAMAKGHKGSGTTGTKSPHGFKAIDANGDGKISFDEFKAYHEAKKDSGKKHKKGKKHETLQQSFDERDQNHDGSITKAEWKATAKHHKGGKHGKK